MAKGDRESPCNGGWWFFREKRDWPAFSKREDGREMRKQWLSEVFIQRLKHCVLQPDLLHPREGPRVSIRVIQPVCKG